MPPHRRSPRSPAATALAVLALVGATLPAACGEDDDSAGATVTLDAGETAAIVADEYSFDPETVIVEGGGPIELSLDNQGSLAHNLRVFDGTEDVGGTETFEGGETSGAELELDPGTYRMVCTVGNHEELGMTGELGVR